MTKACESEYCLFSLVCGFYICGILLWIEVRKSERDPERENKEALRRRGKRVMEQV